MHKTGAANIYAWKLIAFLFVYMVFYGASIFMMWLVVLDKSILEYPGVSFLAGTISSAMSYMASPILYKSLLEKDEEDDEYSESYDD
jgi:hypothetical protein